MQDRSVNKAENDSSERSVLIWLEIQCYTTVALWARLCSLLVDRTSAVADSGAEMISDFATSWLLCLSPAG